MPSQTRCAAYLAAGLLALSPVFGHIAPGRTRDLGDMSLEQLSNIVVSSVSGRAEPLARAMGSVYLITGDDIRRSGATTIMDALRLAPNLEVAQTGTNGYAITARGFNGTLSNKLLVLIDGRSIYTPTYSGVFWDAQDVMLEDVDRIEVISGPGGVLWGANAVNGVINIVTKSAADTQGTLIAAEAGNELARVEGRYGGGGRYRVYAQASRLDDSTLPTGVDNTDGVDRAQVGGRANWAHGPDAITVQGDAYATENNLQPEPDELRGFNVLGRWNRDFGEEAGLRVQAYYDYTSRSFQRLDTLDLEMAHTLSPHGAHTLLWGAGFRQVRDRIENSAAFAFFPAHKNLTSWNVYVQDVIAVRKDLDVTIGTRVDRNEYTGVEFLPSVRLGWRPSDDNLVWTAVSRAVRTPSRFDRELFLPGAPPFLLAGGPDFESEIAYVFELGYRGQPLPRLSWSMTGFYHHLEHQRSFYPGPDGALVGNDREGYIRGAEIWGSVRVTDYWRVWAGYTYLGTELDVRPGGTDLQSGSSIGSDPRQWGKVRAAFDLGKAVELDVMLRHYDKLENISVPSYTAVDVRVGWIVSTHVELSLWVQNLLDHDHIEWAPGAELGRAAVGKAVIRF